MAILKIKSDGPLSLLWEISAGSRAHYFASVVFMLLAVFCNFLLPQIVRFVVDTVVGGLPPDEFEIPLVTPLFHYFSDETTLAGLRASLAWAGALVVALAAVGGACNYIFRRALSAGAEGLVMRLRNRLFAHIQHLPFEWHIGIQTGDIIQRCTSDVDIVRNFVATQLVEIVRAIVLVVFAYSILWPMNATMAAASFAYLPIIFVYSFVFLRGASSRFLDADEAEGQLLAIAQENFSGVRVVRAFGRERYEVDRFDRQNRHFAQLWMKLGELLSTYWGLGDLLTSLQMLTICVVGVFQAAGGNMTVGGFIVFLSYNSMIIWPVRGLGRVLSEAGKTFVSLGRIREILDTPVEQDPPDALATPIEGDIAFDHVSFAYEPGGKPVLQDVSFSIRRGTKLGILGSTGSGKTTIAHLICRLYDLKEGDGAIRIDGTDIRKYRRDWIRSQVGIVLQEPFLYSRTIRENVASLAKHYTMEQIREAARLSQVDEAIDHFAAGYDTIVGERGVTLSGGQKQRVAIARTLLRDPPIMIFDDSLSAVDTQTDARIRAGLRERGDKATTIIIAHRITSIAGADHILVMEGGRVVEQGSPAELLTRGGIYRRIHDLQQSIEDEADEKGE